MLSKRCELVFDCSLLPDELVLTSPFVQITGDDTPALQAVLDADVWRKHLLAEQEVRYKINQINDMRANNVPENQQRTFNTRGRAIFYGRYIHRRRAY